MMFAWARSYQKQCSHWLNDILKKTFWYYSCLLVSIVIWSFEKKNKKKKLTSSSSSNYFTTELKAYSLMSNWGRSQNYQNLRGRTRLPKFKFSAKFPIILHMILQLQIKKIQNLLEFSWVVAAFWCNHYFVLQMKISCQKSFTHNSTEARDFQMNLHKYIDGTAFKQRSTWIWYCQIILNHILQINLATHFLQLILLSVFDLILFDIKFQLDE